MIFVMLMGLAAFLTQLAILSILRYNHTIAVLATTLKRSANDVANSLFCCFVLMTAFAAYMHNEYGPHIAEYSSMARTYSAQISGFMGVFDYVSIYENLGNLGAFMLILYLLTMMNLFLNIFVSILNDYMAAIRKDPNAVPDDHEVVDHLVSMIQDVVGVDSEEAKQRNAHARKLSECSNNGI